jgi:hypothetical protein
VAAYDWNGWLREWNHQLLSGFAVTGRDAFTDPLVTPSLVDGGWLGAPGADEDQVVALEARLGARLPPSYRSFLRTSNGFLQPGMIVPRLLPIDEVGWLRDVDPATIEVWSPGLAKAGAAAPADGFERYLPSALQVSARETVGTAMYLLNPEVVSADGEWEAFYFAHWIPGADRFPSFWELMQREQETFRAPKPPPRAPGISMLDALKWIFRRPQP